MLNRRQIEILLEMCKNPDMYLTASYFAKKQNVSLRTIQEDIKLLKQELLKEKCASIHSETSKGCRIHIDDNEEFLDFVKSLYQQHAYATLNYPASRSSKILLFLLNQHRSISIQTIETEFYISHSTLLNDLKKVSEILQEFNLDLLKNSNKIMIDGLEVNKRFCLADRNTNIMHITSSNGNAYLDSRVLSHIKNILTQTFVAYKYYISDIVFEDAILTLYIAVKRMQEGFFIKSFDLNITDSFEIEIEISESLFKKIEKRFFIKVTEDEIKYFSLYLKGQGNYQNAATISNEMDEFILETFTKIKNNFGIDFTNNINLRISMALHCMPLSIRIKYKMQIKNNNLDYIRNSFPLGYDIGTFFAFYLQEKFGDKIADDEIALISTYFYSSLLEFNNKTGAKRVLVISSMKNSMTILLRQTLINWFSNKISVLDFMNTADITDDILNTYDIFLTTEKGEYFDKGLAMYINAFPNNNDYINIKLSIDGFNGIENIIQIFCEDLFFHLDSQDKTDILYTLCEKSKEKFHLDSLYDEVIKREKIGNTLFSKYIAIPHPIQAISSDTFVAVGISTKGVEWDEDKNEVYLVMLVCIGKNNPRAFQLWDYFAKIFSNKIFVEKITTEPTYNNFIKNVKVSLETGIKKI